MRATHVLKEFRPYLRRPPQNVIDMPSMMHVSEKAMLYWLAQDYYKGRGVIYDAGIFLGASTVSFGEGLRQNANIEQILKTYPKPIQSYERGLVVPTMLKYFTKHGVGKDLKPGDSFAPVLEQFLAPVSDLVELHLGDILTQPPVTGAIEIMFLDVLKWPKIVDLVVQSYFPKLIPGVSVVIQQDYFMPELPIIKVAQEHFRDYFEYVGEICSTAIFRLKEAIPQEEADRFAQSKPDGETQLRLSSIAMQRSIDPYRRMLMALSKARLMVEVRGPEAARDYMRQIAEEFPVQYEDKYWKKNQLAIESAQAFIKKQLPQAV